MKSKTILSIFIGLVLVFTLNFVSADIILPGQHYISIENKITNLDNFPDYVFITSGSMGGLQCPLKVIGNDGIIQGYYKLCSVSVYAVNKSEFAEFNKTLTDLLGNNSWNQYNDYFSAHSVQVLTNIFTSSAVPDADTRTSISNEYTVNSNLLAKNSPDKVTIERSNVIYFYIIAPIIALALIAWIFFKRKGEQL